MKAFGAKWSDLSGKTNPHGVWSPTFLELKLALDNGSQPDQVIEALYAWLEQRKITPQQVDVLLDMEPEAAFEALVGMVANGSKPEGLSVIARQTLRRALQRIAGNYVTKQERDIEQQREKIRSLRKRHNVESAASLVQFMLS